VEERPETCRAVYRNKQTVVTLHLVGYTLEYNEYIHEIRVLRGTSVLCSSLYQNGMYFVI